jgi:hypothetical protein
MSADKSAQHVFIQRWSGGLIRGVWPLIHTITPYALSYPRIIHTESKDVTGGTITCTSFVDANGDVHYDWIPAIRLWKE